MQVFGCIFKKSDTLPSNDGFNNIDDEDEDIHNLFVPINNAIISFKI